MAPGPSSRTPTLPGFDGPGFPLLDLIAMFAHMDEQDVGLVLDHEAIAIAVLEQVRRPEGPRCPHCGAAVNHQTSARMVCPACAKRYSATTGTIFENSPQPLRLWFAVLGQTQLSDPRLADEQLHRHFGPDFSAAPPIARRLAQAFAHFAPSIGLALAVAMPPCHPKAAQDLAMPALARYLRLTAARERLSHAQAQGLPILELPPGMTLGQAIGQIEVRIAQEEWRLAAAVRRRRCRA